MARVRAAGRAREKGQSVVEFALLAPLMVFMLFAIIDFARIYTAMASVESAAREAADFATSLGAERWSSTNVDATIAEMERRACIAASDLPDYAGPDDNCANPLFDFCVIQALGGSCDPVDSTVASAPTYTCDQPDRNPPCWVKVRMSHVFHLFVPLHLDFFGVQLGLPDTLAFDRDSTFAMTDIEAP